MLYIKDIEQLFQKIYMQLQKALNILSNPEKKNKVGYPTT